MLKTKLKQLIEKYGISRTKEIIEKQIQELQEEMRKAPSIYHAIDIEHDIMDRQSMLRSIIKQNI